MSGVILAADQLTKRLITASFAPGHSVPVLPPLLSLTYVQNTGAAFGVLKGHQWFFIAISCVVIVWILREFRRVHRMTRASQWACALILGGAVGNLVDRLRLGYVVDFIDVHVWPVFNIGDSAITIGVALLVLHAFATRHSPD